ncbi:MAG: hypothetical protein ACKOA1_04065 [Bacteroidota bacterium]
MPTQPFYFFTSPDPDYLPKGSRDPLGFQVIWQHQARKLIPFLSTVSNSLRDFQILCTARYLYKSKNNSDWSKYFLRFEQLMSYARYLRYPENAGFNGIEKVRQRLNDSSKYWVSNLPTDEILSNQRPYGILGKYIRPFSDIAFDTHPEFDKIYGDKTSAVKKDPEASRLLDKVLSGDRFSVDRTSLPALFPLFDISNEEREYLTQKLIRIEEKDNWQNRLYDYVDSTDLPDEFELYPFLKGFGKFLRPDEVLLQSLLEEHAKTERVLSPMNTIFRYLQTKPLWTRQSIDHDDYISACNRPFHYDFVARDHQAELLNQMGSLMGSSNWNVVMGLAKRNEEVTGWRGGNAWISVIRDVLEVRHSDGALKKDLYDPELDHENSYVLPAYISIYRQLKNR